MKVLILNSILFTADNYRIPKVKTIKDTMIYSVCLGFKELGHEVTLVAADDYRPTDNEDYDFEILFFHSCYKRVF
jgi:1,2-diacylglycerol 3-alpha-glucosyltransferase